MPQQGANGIQRGARAQHVGRSGVPEQIGSAQIGVFDFSPL